MILWNFSDQPLLPALALMPRLKNAYVTNKIK